MEFFHNNSKRSSQCTWKSWHIIIKKHKLFCIHGITLHLVKFLLPRTDHIPRNFFFKPLSCGVLQFLRAVAVHLKCMENGWLVLGEASPISLLHHLIALFIQQLLKWTQVYHLVNDCMLALVESAPRIIIHLEHQ